MNTVARKIASVGLSVTMAVWLSGATMIIPAASAATTEELQAQIAQLLTMIQSLQAQLSVAQGSPAPATTFTQNLTLGSKGAEVKALQQWLNAKGYPVAASGPGSPGSESTYFGSKTAAALAKWQAANGISPAVGYFGPKTRAAIAAMSPAPGPGPSPVPIPATGLAASLASDTPGENAVPKGAGNVTYTKFNLAGSGTVNTVTVKRVGAGQATDFSNVYLYDGPVRLTSGRSVNTSSHEATFTGLNLAVSGVKMLSVIADMAAGAGAAGRNAFSVTAVNADVAVTGLPVTGKEMTVSAATSGTLTIAKSGSLGNPNIGQPGAAVSQFKLTTANEDIKISRIAMFSGGTTSKSNLTTFVLQDLAGNTLATASGVNAKDLIVFDLASPVTILKGDSKDFKVLASIGGAAKRNDTIALYIDEANDVYGVGQQYGQGATVTKTMDSTAANHHVLTIQGATLTTTFLGPNTGDIKKNGKDQVLYRFSMAAANNVEVRKLHASIATTAGSLIGDSQLTDFKVVDEATGVTVAGPSDVTIANIDAVTGVNFTDIFNVNAGQTRTFKMTADIPTDWDNSDAIRVTLTAFAASADVKNLDNNQFLVAAEITPSTALQGNTQTVKAPTLELSLAGNPASQSFVKGTQAVPFVGIGLRAIADDIKVTTIKVTSTSASTGQTDAMAIADLQNFALYDGDTRISDIKSLATFNASSADATFSNLSFVIAKGQSKTLVLKGNLSVSATSNNTYSIGIRVATTSNTAGSDIVAVDSEGNEPTYTSSFNGPGLNMLADRVITVLSAGTITIATAPDDVESKAGIITTSASKTVLGKFRITAANEALTIKKMKLLVNNDSSTAASATSTAEVTKVYLYDGSTQIGSTAGYTPIGSGSAAGDVVIEDLGLVVPKDGTKTLTVKADTNTIASGATSGRSVYVHFKDGAVAADGFEATGSASTIYDVGSAGGAKGNLKVLYKTYPGITVASPGGTVLTNGSNDLIKFTVTNKSSNEQISWNVVSFNVSAAAATVPLFKVSGAFDPAATFTLRDMTNSVNLTITTTATAGAPTAGNYTFYLGTEEVIPAGASREYKITGSVIAPGSNSSVSTQLVLRQDTSTASITKGVAYATARATGSAGGDAVVDDADSGFVWSDNSATAHALTTADWANGVYVDTYPSDIFTRQN